MVWLASLLAMLYTIHSATETTSQTRVLLKLQYGSDANLKNHICLPPRLMQPKHETSLWPSKWS